MIKNIYLIPGFGLRSKVFEKIQIHDAILHHLDWIEPYKREDLSSYASRISEPIKAGANNLLIGHSFGGMVGLKIAQLKRIDQCILISAPKNRNELPVMIKILKFLPLYKLYNDRLRKLSFTAWCKALGLHKKEDQLFLKEALLDAPGNYRNWAMNQIANFDQIDWPKEMLQVHGEKDQLFTAKMEGAQLISSGDHFMVWREAEKLSKIINDYISRYS